MQDYVEGSGFTVLGFRADGQGVGFRVLSGWLRAPNYIAGTAKGSGQRPRSYRVQVIAVSVNTGKQRSYYRLAVDFLIAASLIHTKPPSPGPPAKPPDLQISH